ncbi:MAG: P-loop NTPase, partial [Bdellovibrionales bacterium]|nr:P-loop NTPase [Bdellovibrionales bacterium]
IIFVSGKGGVGKSTLAATLAFDLSQKGRKTLLVELGASSFFESFLGVPAIHHAPTLLKKDLWVSRWDTDSCLREYVVHYIKAEKMYQLFFENRIMKSLIDVAPPLKELAILGKITSSILKVGPPMDYEHIVVDAFSTGHFLALLRAPRGIGQAIQKGPMGEQSRRISEVIANPKHTAYCISTLMDELPVSESLILGASLRNEFGAEPLVFCNKVLKSPLSDQELAHLSSGGTTPESIARFAQIFSAKIQVQNEYRRVLAEIGPSKDLNLQTEAKDGWDLIERLRADLVTQ